MTRDVQFYREIGNQKWFTSLWRCFRAWHVEEASDLEMTASADPSAIERLVVHQSPLASLAAELGELYQDFRNPPARFEPTAAPEFSALDNLIDHPSPFKSTLGQLTGIVSDIRNHRTLHTTAERIEISPIWSKRRTGAPLSLSMGAHLLFVIVLFWGFSFAPTEPLPVTETLIPLYIPADLMELPAERQTSAGGGGGGRETLTPPSAGQPPRAARQQLVPPAAEPPLNTDPFLVAEPTIVAPQLAAMLPVTVLDLGDPMAGIPAPPSSGPGLGGGIGTGQGRGVGEGDGPGLGAGEGGGFGGGVFEVGGGVSPPEILFRRDPVYSEDARKAQYEGTVVLEAIVRKDGSVDILRVLRGLGLGLDENAIAALKEWKFKPGMRQGVPVDVAVNIEVNFTLR